MIHLNLRDHLLLFRFLIGQVMLDKVPGITMVVNKTNVIDNTFRNFSMEVVAGKGDTVATVKENGRTFQFDFAKMYWNPRLSTEHERIVNKLKDGDVLYDVMAGVGPFTIPAARKKCRVVANDLNPDSFKWLNTNCKINKVNDRVLCHNVDGKEFIRTQLKEDLLQVWNDRDFNDNIHITMNLPAMAVEFLPSFVDLISEEDIPKCIKKVESLILPVEIDTRSYT
ncbi:tRNA (guanine(37)-N(1))-methyltransferase-like [Oratosquilla oratoria]|uniref:tRNA (guanine(37)-N(1))-methyltransferase-like n=1 Tax=Oratosquilla oratoria TaxID=337810 RepID=UPI003F76EB20